MLNLPHKPPLLFAKKLIFKNEHEALVSVEFNSVPSLAMTMEAAAQSSIVLCEEKKEGYVLSCSNLISHKTPKGKIFTAYIRLKTSVDTINEICFEIKDEQATISSGTLLLMLKS